MERLELLLDFLLVWLFLRITLEDLTWLLCLTVALDPIPSKIGCSSITSSLLELEAREKVEALGPALSL